MLTSLGVAVFLSMSVMVFSIYLYGQQVYGSGGAESSLLSSNLTSFMQYASLVFATPVLFLLGLPILRNAAVQWRNGVVSTDALVVLGVAAAFVYSYVSTLRESGMTYYETACMILVLVTLGRWLEASGKLRAAEAVESLEALLPTEVAIRRKGETVTVPARELQEGDNVLVPAGARIVVDGVIKSGHANVDEQIITGESAPILRRPGDQVRAGTLNLDGALTIRAVAVGTQTTVGRLAALLEAAKRSKCRYERLANRVASVFLPFTVCLAVVAGVLGFTRGGTDSAIMTALTVLLIACPCALGIATPLAIWVALGRAATAGALFRNGEAIERLAAVKAFCFDKSGTLTTGTPSVVSFIERNPENGSNGDDAMAVATGLAQASNHVAAQGVADYARHQHVAPVRLDNIRTLPGRGLVGRRPDCTAFLGNVPLMQEQGLSFDPQTGHARQHAFERGQGVTCVGWDSAVRGVFVLSEHIRSEAKRAIHALKSLGCKVTVLTGDHEQRGRSIASALEVEAIAEMLPEDKVRLVQETRCDVGPVAMVGDGLNDAPALAAAAVGIAMGCGADVTRESADVCLLGNDLDTLPWLVTLARKTRGTIQLNLFWAFVYNVIGMSLAVAGKLSPILAAGAMVASSLFVLTNSLRLAGRAGLPGSRAEMTS